MSNDQLMTYGALGFAAFALYQFANARPGAAVATQPAQQKRDVDLAGWFDQLVEQQRLADVSLALSKSAVPVDASGALVFD